MSVSEQMRREKTRAITIAIFELTLGAIMIFIGIQFFSAGDFLKFALYEMQQSAYTPEYTIDLVKTMITATLGVGLFALIHGIKRMADNLLNAWVKSAPPEKSK